MCESFINFTKYGCHFIKTSWLLSCDDLDLLKSRRGIYVMEVSHCLFLIFFCSCLILFLHETCNVQNIIYFWEILLQPNNNPFNQSNIHFSNFNKLITDSFISPAFINSVLHIFNSLWITQLKIKIMWNYWTGKLPFYFNNFSILLKQHKSRFF